MFWNAVFQVGIFLAIVTAVSVPLGLYMARVFAHEPTFLDPVLAPIERLIYRVCRVRPGNEMTWGEYAVAMLLFSMVGMLVLYAMQRLQGFLPLNPQKMSGVATDLAFNTAASFTTNTNWQAYGGESTMSYLTQMAGLAFHNFVSAAAGIAVAIAVIRGFVRRSAKTLGNFWVDLTRATLWVLLPISRRLRAGAGLAGRSAELQSIRTRQDRRGRRAGGCRGPGRLAGGHQGAGNQRRRLFQRQLARIPMRIRRR